ncbi:MAG: efflux RND transporter periplasmic adaptor subunit [Clostridia bacterium]|nr:efflux RND transporter periplasmic adaptor subunit [Clostridia bacterium]
MMPQKVKDTYNKSKEFVVNKKDRFKKLPKKKKIIIITALILVVFILAGMIVRGAGKKQGKDEIATATATMGNVSVIISGTGTVEANDQYDITSLVKGEIIADYFEEGDIVEKDALLYKIDTKDMENSISKSQISLDNATNNYNSALEDVSNLNVKSPIDGVVTNVYVKVGDNVNSGTKIADVIDSSKMLLTVPFISEDANTLYVGQTASVKLDNSFYETTGTVTKITSGELINSYGAAIKNVEILVDNPGSIREGDTATAVAGDVACNDSGTFEYNATETIEAEVSGKVRQMIISAGDKVIKNGVVAVLDSDSVNKALRERTNSLKDAQLSLDNQYDNLENYEIKAPISGTVLQKNSKAGDNLDNSQSNNSSAMAVIADLSRLLFKINVDELDVTKIEVGQEVSITVDAIEGKTFTGFVDYVSLIGTSTNGVTSYPVTVVINEPDGIIPGMNVSANIMVQSKQNVLTVPVSAIQRGNFVYVKSSDAKKQPETENMMPKNIPDGFTAVKVETGINDDNNIEIVSGLSEGDVVYVTQSTNTMSGIESMMRMRGEMMGGGMPSGGMPSGGMMGGRP